MLTEQTFNNCSNLTKMKIKMMPKWLWVLKMINQLKRKVKYLSIKHQIIKCSLLNEFE